MRDHTISRNAANGYGLLLAVFLYLVLFALARFLMPEFSLRRGFGAGWALWALVIASLPVHEWLHVFGFRRFGAAPVESTRMLLRGWI